MDLNKEKELKTNLVCRAKIKASIDEAYDFECVAVPIDNKQLNYDYENGVYFNQILRANPENINSSYLESGLPLFDNHPWNNSAQNTLGITVGYDFTEYGLVVRCKWGSRADEALRNDVKNGIIKTVSIEGDVQSYFIERNQGEIPNYYTEMWTPTSLSFAPVPNDIGAQIGVKRALQAQLSKDIEPNDSFLSKLTNKF